MVLGVGRCWQGCASGETIGVIWGDFVLVVDGAGDTT